ncbi:MAG: hypothetical protein HRU33_00620 [Rhodobacteraceae bacterium]|nr:hypothetical protein [Paracoccaceae bacterium]
MAYPKQRPQDKSARGKARHAHQPPRHLILLGAATDLGIQLADLVIETGLCLDQDLQCWARFVGQATCCILYDRNQACGIRCRLWNQLSELRPPPRLIALKSPAGQCTMAQLALIMHMFTGCRPSDAIWIGRDNIITIKGVKILQWQPRKVGAAKIQIPLAPPLLKAVSAGTKTGPACILSDHGCPDKNPEIYRMRFRRRCDEARFVDRLSHGLRKALAERLAEEGGSEYQIMAGLSHTKPSMSAIYTKGAERRLMAIEAMGAINGIEW